MAAPDLLARSWSFTGVSKQLEAEFVGMKNGWVVLKDTNGKSFEFALENFKPGDQRYLKDLAAGISPPATDKPGGPATSASDYDVRTEVRLVDQVVTLTGKTELHITGKGDPISGSTIIFNSPDAWLFLDNVPPSVVESTLLDRMRVGEKKADPGTNIRVVQYGPGTVVIPHEKDFAALTLHDGKDLSGDSIPLECYIDHNATKLGKLKGVPASFVLKRGYTATLAKNADGSGPSRNYVAQDHDVVVNSLPKGLDEGLVFVRVFPWRWVSKKGIAGGIWKEINAAWFYNWNIGQDSTPGVEYVGIKQKAQWPSLDQDWEKRGINHLLGFNEPDKKDQADMSVDQAISQWPKLLATGLRLGSPSTSDGGLNWLYQFMERADAAGLRVDFVTVHYYRAANNPGDPDAAAAQFHQFLKAIHDRVKRPLWVTEWNNGASWTKAPDPSPKQQAAAIEAMIKMLDSTPFVERYAPFQWVEDCRLLIGKDGKLTPSGEVYRDHQSPLSFTQPK